MVIKTYFRSAYSWFFTGLFLFGIANMACSKQKYNSGPGRQTTGNDTTIVLPGDSAKNILFIGNSLTYFNDLPGKLIAIGRANGKEIITTMVAYPNYALEDHWNAGRIQTLIATGKFHFVVIQQGPSSLADGRVMLQDYGARIKTLCDQYKSRLAFFMVWPAYSNFHTFDGVIKNYTDAATATRSLLCPVGLRWKNYFLASGDYSFLGPDMFHPSEKGTENAAGIIYETLF